MRKHLISFALALLTLVVPASALADTTNAPAKPSGLPPELNDFLRTADTFIIFSVEPHPDFENKSTNTLCAHNIVGQLTMKRPETRSSLIEALDKGVRAFPRPPSDVVTLLPDCFNPRHGIRSIKDDESIDLLICFECSQIQVSSNKKRSWFLMTDKSPLRPSTGF